MKTNKWKLNWFKEIIGTFVSLSKMKYFITIKREKYLSTVKEINHLNEILKQSNMNLHMKNQKINVYHIIESKIKSMIKEINGIAIKRIKDNKKASITEASSIENKTGKTHHCNC
jgi:hypothetical protein